MNRQAHVRSGALYRDARRVGENIGELCQQMTRRLKKNNVVFLPFFLTLFLISL